MTQFAQSAFDFSDSYGSDPILRRYMPTTSMDLRSAEISSKSSLASREAAEANLAKVQAEYTARLAPMKSATEAIKSMSDMMKTQSAMQEEASIQRSAAAISEGLPKATNLESVIALGNSNLMGLKDSVVGPQWRNSALNAFRQEVDNAQSADEVDRAFARLPASVAFEPEFKGLHDIAKNQAVLRQTVREKFAAEPSLGAVPTTTAGGVDVTAAGLAIAAKGGEEARKEKARENIKLLQRETSDLESYMAKEMQRLGIEDLTPQPGVVIPRDLAAADLRLRNYRKNLESLYNELGIGDSATGVQPPKLTPEQAPSTEPTGGMPKPWQTTPATGTTEPSASDKAAQASAVATSGETPPLTPAAEAKPNPVPISLEEEAALAAQQAAPKTEPMRGRAAMAMEAKRKRDEKNRTQILKDERTRLQTAIFQKKGRGGGGRVTTILKPGLTMDNDVVQRTLARINEITTEIGE